MVTRAIKASAKRHLRTALAFGWTDAALACDYAEKALEAEGHDSETARSAVSAVWANDFKVTTPN